MKLGEPTAFAEGLAASTIPGPGPRVLWIHGYTMSSEIWEDLWFRLPNWSHIGIDLPGHGASPPPNEPQALPDLARMIGRAAIEQRVEHVIGLSFGAIVALQVGIELPEAFRTITLAAASLTGGPDEVGARDRYRELGRLYFEHGPGPWMTETWMARPPDIFTGAADHPQLWRDMAAVIGKHSWSELKSGFVHRWVSYRQLDHLDDLERIRAELLLIIGEREMETFRASAEKIRSLVVGSAIVDIPNAGHLCILEAPDTSSRIIAEHLTRHAQRDLS